MIDISSDAALPSASALANYYASPAGKAALAAQQQGVKKWEAAGGWMPSSGQFALGSPASVALVMMGGAAAGGAFKSATPTLAPGQGVLAPQSTAPASSGGGGSSWFNKISDLMRIPTPGGGSGAPDTSPGRRYSAAGPMTTITPRQPGVVMGGGLSAEERRRLQLLAGPDAMIW